MHVRGHIDDKTMEYLTPEDPKPGRFYLLPNIHKENNPGRPIVSANGHPTEKISEFIDFHLRPFVKNLPSHQRYYRILEENGKFNHSRKYHACYDGCNFLYTNIPRDDGIAACRKIWEQRTVQEPPTECLVEMLTLVLKTKSLLLTETTICK
jgi:hypothetical protein